MMMMKSVFWWRKPEYPEETTDLRQVTDETFHTGNYRGISILVALAKLYDMVGLLSDRFQLGYKPKFEQAGAQRGRGCEEQILTTRLLIDIARKRKLALWVAFVDYKKAYDMVDRRTLLQLLDEKECGTTFLKAVRASLIGAFHGDGRRGDILHIHRCATGSRCNVEK